MRTKFRCFIAAIALVVAGSAQAPQEFSGREVRFKSDLTGVRFLITAQTDPRPPELPDPVHGWLFSWYAYAFIQRPDIDSKQFSTRFALFTQSETDRDRSVQAARYLLRLWDMAAARLTQDHPLDTRIIEVFMAWGGERTGGEHRILTVPPKPGQMPRKQSVIYIYQTSTLNDPLEWVRELAHEYGHAALFGPSGYTEPEPWATGRLGELLFLRWTAQEMAANRLEPKDAMGVTPDRLQAWLKANATPLEQAVWTRGLNPTRLNGKDRAAMDEYLGLALFAEAAYGSRILARAMRASGGNRPIDFLSGLTLALDEQRSVTVQLPETARQRPVRLFLPGAPWKAAGVTMKPAGNGWFNVRLTGKSNRVTFTHKPAE